MTDRDEGDDLEDDLEFADGYIIDLTAQSGSGNEFERHASATAPNDTAVPEQSVGFNVEDAPPGQEDKYESMEESFHKSYMGNQGREGYEKSRVKTIMSHLDCTSAQRDRVLFLSSEIDGRSLGGVDRDIITLGLIARVYREDDQPIDNSSLPECDADLHHEFVMMCRDCGTELDTVKEIRKRLRDKIEDSGHLRR